MLVRETYPAIDRLINRMQAFGAENDWNRRMRVRCRPGNVDSVSEVLGHLAEVKVSLLSNRSMLYTCALMRNWGVAKWLRQRVRSRHS